MKVPNRFTNSIIFDRRAGSSRLRWSAQLLVILAAFALIFATWPVSLAAQQQGQSGGDQSGNSQPADQSAGQPTNQQDQEQSNGQAYTQQTPEQLQQLVAPIALYPDSLVAQILAATTFPAEIVEADRWVQAHPELKGDDLAKAVDQMTWDPSVKALTGFPTVLGNMDKNISWTSSLGDAYYNQQQDVMDAVQVMRQKAQTAGNLKSTEQQTVETQGSTIEIQPTNPQIVYVPAYNPWIIYGGPIVAWPGWYPYPGIWYGGPGPYLSWGVGFGIGWYGGYGWGWNNWGFNWHNRVIVYNHNTYISHSRTFYNRNVYYRHGGDRGVAANPRGSFDNRGRDNHPTEARGNQADHRTDTRGNQGDRRADTRAPGNVYNQRGETNRPFEGDNHAARGYAPRTDTGTRSGAFSGYDHGGESRGYSSRGSSSFGGGGGGFRGGGGGGGGRGGGGRR
ncbi:MAG: DUF3300 domain-containing protein [Candidatus Acidiferrales bacterium]